METKIPDPTAVQIGTTPIIFKNKQLTNSDDQDIDFSDIQIPDFSDIQIPDIEVPNVQYEDNPPPQKNIPQFQPQTNGQKYNILDLFWLIKPSNRKHETSNDDIESKFITISYNLDFGNLKVTLYDITPDSIKDNIVFIKNMNLLVSGTIYPSSAFKLLNVNGNIKFTCIEQLITNTNEPWQNERPIVSLQKSADDIQINIYNKLTNKTYFYKFVDWQINAFKEALKMTYTNGLTMRSNILNQNR